MTFELHSQFINAAKMDELMERIGHIHYYVYKLPQNHFRMLELVIKHLKKLVDAYFFLKCLTFTYLQCCRLIVGKFDDSGQFGRLFRTDVAPTEGGDDGRHHRH